MKPLNRPMFKYGGPIKEGIMSGMKDNVNTPKRGMVDGPGSYAGFLIPAAIQAGRFLLRPFGQFVTKQIAKKGITAGSGAGTIRSGLGKSRVLKPGESLTTEKSIFQPNPLGKYFMQSPEGRFIAGSSGFAGTAGKKVLGAGKSIAKSPLTVGSILYYGGGKLLPDGTPDPEDPKNYKPAGEGGKSGAPGGGDPDMFLTPRTKDDPKKTKSEENEALKQKYYKIMGLDKMKKDSIYDSLIDASKIVQQEGGDLKGAIKSGSLQSQIINAISKNLDDSAKLKRQVDAAVLKGEIEKDIKANDPSAKLAAELTKKRIDIADKTLAGDTLAETVNKVYERTGAFPSGTSLAAVARTKGIEITSTADTTELTNYKNENKGKNEIDFLEEIVAKGGASDGNYVVGNRILVVQGGKVIPYL